MFPILLFLTSASAAPPVPDARCHLLVRLVDSSRVDLVDVGTGTVSTVVEGIALDATGLRGLARFEDTLLASRDGVVQRISLADGAVRATSLPCTGIAGGDSLVVLGEGIRPATVYEDGAAAISGASTTSQSLVLPAAHTAASDRGDVLTASHASAAIRRWSVADGSYIASMYLEGVDLPIWGMSVVGDVLYILDDGRTEADLRNAPELLAFDVRDGALLAAVTLPDRPAESPRGLVCTAP